MEAVLVVVGGGVRRPSEHCQGTLTLYPAFAQIQLGQAPAPSPLPQKVPQMLKAFFAQ